MADPILDGGQIQGDSLAGFRKDFARFLFGAIPPAAVAQARAWLAATAPEIAYLDAVHAFNTAFSRMRARQAADPPMSACWVNVAFTVEGLRLLAPGWDYSGLDGSFAAGAAQSAAFLGDPADGGPADPTHWQIGRIGQTVHLMVTLAGDVEADVGTKAAAVLADWAERGIELVFDQAGATRPGDAAGHEHFGFKDGISQPGVLGRIGAGGPLVTHRILAPADPLAATFSAPGEPLLWPGEFVVGYPRKVSGSTDPNATVTDALPAWMRNDSYLVFRKLRQDVPGFAEALAQEAARISALPGFDHMTPERLGALVVGRWRSGAPVMRTPLAENPSLGADSDAANSFFFDKDTAPVTYDPAVAHRPDTAPYARRDGSGAVCPLSAHIRKVNPRDDVTDQGSSVRTFEHRIIRRGIPFGPEYDPKSAGSREAERGLLFVCYQRSIKVQFEFLQHSWANSTDAPHDGAGLDLVIGQGAPADRTLALRSPGGQGCQVSFGPFVQAVGTVYLFAPGRAALEQLAAG